MSLHLCLEGPHKCCVVLIGLNQSFHLLCYLADLIVSLFNCIRRVKGGGKGGGRGKGEGKGKERREGLPCYPREKIRRHSLLMPLRVRLLSYRRLERRISWNFRRAQATVSAREIRGDCQIGVMTFRCHCYSRSLGCSPCYLSFCLFFCASRAPLFLCALSLSPFLSLFPFLELRVAATRALCGWTCGVFDPFLSAPYKIH